MGGNEGVSHPQHVGGTERDWPAAWRAVLADAPGVASLLLRRADGVIVEAGGAFCERLGLPCEEVIGRPIASLPLWPAPRELRRLVVIFGRTGSVRDEEVRFRDAVGAQGLARVSARIVPQDQGKFVLVVVRDVTAERRAAAEATRERELAAALRREAELGAALATVVPSAGGRANLQPVLEQIVRMATQVLPASGGANIVLLGEDGEELIIAASTVDVSAPREPAPRIRARGGVTRHIIRRRRVVHIGSLSEESFGSRRQLAAFGLEAYLGAPLLAHDEALGALFVFSREPRDWTRAEIDFVTALANRTALLLSNARLYEHLEQANVALQEAARAKDEFLASMSHELRTPLNAILGMSEALQEGLYGPVSADQDRCLQIVRDSGRHLLSLIEDILDLATIESGGLPLWLRPVSLPDVCRQAVELVTSEARKKGLHIDVALDPLVRLIEADERRLKQVLVNLLANAVKFTPADGAIGLTSEGDPEAKVVRLIVWDTGIGIASEDLDRLFQPFVQLDSSLARRYEGVGLGLALSARMVALHGGTIELQSEVGEGSRFVVTLPWRLPTAPEDPEQAP